MQNSKQLAFRVRTEAGLEASALRNGEISARESQNDVRTDAAGAPPALNFFDW
jgi:hypothetical protein